MSAKKKTPKVAKLPRQVWFLRSKLDGLLVPRPYYTRKDARAANKRVYDGWKDVVGPFVLAERARQE